MIELRNDNIFGSGAEALVNPVNTMGVSGKGLALQFKAVFPDNFRFYNTECAKGRVKPGDILTFWNRRGDNPRFIFNFATKSKWWFDSKPEYIADGLQALVREVEHRSVQSIAIPALGCGCGALDWAEVHLLIAIAFEKVPNVKVFLYPPEAGHAFI